MHNILFPALILIVITATPLSAQNRYDDNWFFARVNYGLQLNFAGDALNVSYVPQVDTRMVEASVTMSDASGNLLFYSNNCSISNARHEIMENGDELNPGFLQTYFCTVSPFANPGNQSIMALPHPAKPNIYYVFHVDLEVYNWGLPPNGSQTSPLHLYVTTVDMDQGSGLGAVVEKNAPVIEDTLAWSSLTAVRHANGRDWWLMCAKYKSNCYYTILIDPSGIHVQDKQCAGYIWGDWDTSGGTHFTPDGSKYVRSQNEFGLNIFDFDRCTGQLSNPVHISHAPDTNRICTMEISGNSRFVYAIFLKKIYQYDLWAADIAASKTLVATYDGAISAGNTTDFYHAKLAPDGKIYICTYGPTYVLHTIDQPDSAGLACNVLQHNILLPSTHYASVPNAPNFRLGALPGPCDTISVGIKPSPNIYRKINVAPNPASDLVDIRFEEPAPPGCRIRLLDMLGREVLSARVVTGRDQVQIPLLTIQNGWYMIELSAEGLVVGTQKICIVH